MLRKKPETLALIVALVSTVVVLAVFLTDLLVARYREIDNGERRLQQVSVMIAEHTARAFESIDVLLRETAIDLAQNRRNWEKWEPAQGWEYVAQRHSRSMPHIRDIAVYDASGNQRFISTYFPPPKINVKDRPYFQQLQAGDQSASFGPYIGRNSGRYTYALLRRINGDGGRFAGVALGAVEPGFLSDFCWSNRLSDDFEAVLVNNKGLIVASCRPTDLSRQSPVLGALAVDILFDGKLRGLTERTGNARGNDLFISVIPIPGFPELSILAAIPEKTLLSQWRSRMLELGTLAILVTVVLIVGALLVRRQVRELSTMTNELSTSHEQLQQRITEATAELAQRKDAAERANKAKSRFLAAASHDLRQPLHALSLFSADLKRQLRSPNPSELPRIADQIATSTGVLGELLDSLLDISRLDVEGVKPDIRSFELAPLFERLTNAFRRAAADRNLTLRIRNTRAWVRTDAVMLERMLANLISNAIRYTPPGGRILVAARARGKVLRIDVRDNGKGIAPEHQAAIFAEFYQVDNNAREHEKGLGLGLSIVDRLARALQIKVSLRSQLAQGTAFTLEVPTGTPQEHKSLSTALPTSAGRVHFIGDSTDIQACIELAKRWNFTVSTNPVRPILPAPDDCVIIADSAMASGLGDPALTGGNPLVVLTGDSDAALPEGSFKLSIPIRPAKLRAILNQVQKAASKSIP